MGAAGRDLLCLSLAGEAKRAYEEHRDEIIRIISGDDELLSRFHRMLYT
jgi:hypothetical protein